MHAANTEDLYKKISEFWGFHAPKLHQGCEARCSGGLRINFNHVGTLNMRRNLYAWAFLFLASIKKTSCRGRDTESLGSSA